ncbi:MAG: acyl-CoA dehydrogenase family protein [Rhodobacteraceae bacterium]|nr:acyl-CoA dehydrogenase family protein [Paracoccaceae bacterium]
MDFRLSDDQSAIRDMALAFGSERIAPYARDWESAGEMPEQLWRQAGELGLGAINARAESGGSALSRLDAALIFEALARSCPSVAAFLSIHNMCVNMIDSFGSEALKSRYMEDVTSMRRVLSYCLTEPGCGSDAAALRTRAERTNHGWSVTGTKAFISGGGYSDSYVVMCRTGGDGPGGISALLIDADAPGISFGALEDKMGWRSQPTRQVQLDQCVVAAENLLGEEGLGFRYAMAGLDGGRLNIAACSLGGAQAALEQTLSYMRTRSAFGRKLSEFQSLQFRLAEMEIEMQAARSLLWHAAWKLDQGAADAGAFCAMAKSFATDTGFKVANGCLQLHGGYGYFADYGIEKIVRDLRVHQILEGTNEIMRVIISRHLLSNTDR